MVFSTADFFSFKEADDAVLCAKPGMTFHRRVFPKGWSGCHGEFQGSFLPWFLTSWKTALVNNCTSSVAYFSLASSKDESFAAMLILEIAPRAISVHQGRVLLPQQGGHTPKKPWRGSPETRDEFI